MDREEVAWYTWSRALVAVYCVAQCVLYSLAAFVFPELKHASPYVVAGHVVLLVARECLARLADQRRSRRLFSLCWVAAYAVTDTALLLADRRSKLVDGLDGFGMGGLLVLQALQGVYMRTIALHGWARLGAAACNVALWCAIAEPWSELGKPYEALGVGAFHLLGELQAVGPLRLPREGGKER